MANEKFNNKGLLMTVLKHIVDHEVDFDVRSSTEKFIKNGRNIDTRTNYLVVIHATRDDYPYLKLCFEKFSYTLGRVGMVPVTMTDLTDFLERLEKEFDTWMNEEQNITEGK